MITAEGKLVLVVEDDPPMRRLLHITLKHQGYRLAEARTGKQAIELAHLKSPSIVLLDLGLPDVDGLEVTRIIRRTSRVPIIVISALHAQEQKVAALDGGADDYLTKPFGSEELLARIRVAIRHGALVEVAEGEDEPRGIFGVGELRVDFNRRRVVSSGKEVHLTPTEYKLLSVLIGSADKVVTHKRLLEQVWGPASSEQINYLRVYMKQLRTKIEPDPACPRYLVTEPAIGYRLRGPDC